MAVAIHWSLVLLIMQKQEVFFNRKPAENNNTTQGLDGETEDKLIKSIFLETQVTNG